jgi:methanogenic corrinoid protein MtbC1
VIALADLRGRYLRAQLAGDRREAARVVLDEGLAAGASVLELQHEVIGGAQDLIGQLWQKNQISIAQEHMATAISQVVMSLLFERAEPAPRLGKRALIACVEGELHELPARLVADYLDGGGFTTRYLGANVPTDHLLAMIHEERPDLIGLSCTMSFHAAALRIAIARIRERSQVPIMIGGHALKWAQGLAEEVGVTGVGRDPAALIATARRLVGLS